MLELTINWLWYEIFTVIISRMREAWCGKVCASYLQENLALGKVIVNNNGNLEKVFFDTPGKY